MVSTGTKINLVGFIIKKMLKILREKEKETTSKRKKTSLSLFAIPYVTLITHYAKSVELLQPKYEMVQIAVVYNLASIAKMGYKDPDNIGNLSRLEVMRVKTMNQLKLRKLIHLVRLWMFWQTFRSVLEISTHGSIVWMNVLTF